MCVLYHCITGRTIPAAQVTPLYLLSHLYRLTPPPPLLWRSPPLSTLLFISISRERARAPDVPHPPRPRFPPPTKSIIIISRGAALVFPTA